MTATIAARHADRHAIDLLAAQRATYNEVKLLRRTRATLVTAGAAATVVLALVLESVRLPVGLATGVGLLVLAVLAGGRERDRRQSAAAVQEEFDTYVFGLPWNRLLAERPATAQVARCAARYRRRHSDAGLAAWYPPVDEQDRIAAILLCQRANVSWSAPLHRQWATVLAGTLGVLGGGVVLVGGFGPLGVPDLVAAVVAPLLAPVHGLVEALREHLHQARRVARLDAEIVRLWRSRVDGTETVGEHDCRQVQDQLLQLRESGPPVPDRLYLWRRRRLESTVRAETRHLETRGRQVRAAGLAMAVALTATPHAVTPGRDARALSADAYRTFVAAPVSGDPGAPAVVWWVRDAAACTTAAGGATEVERLAADITLAVDDVTVFGGDPKPDHTPGDEEGPGGAVLRAGPAEFLAVVPLGDPEPRPLRVTMSCRRPDGSWTTAMDQPWTNPGFDDVAMLMPPLDVDEGGTLDVVDVQAYYGGKVSSAAAFGAEIDGTPAIVEDNDQDASVTVRPSGPVRPGVRLLTLWVAGRELTTPFIQRGTPQPSAPASDATAERATAAGSWTWVLGAVVLAAGIVAVVIVRRRRA
ncbi:S-4TM family putative pore-forming effector [Phytohabitans aurantiacus]|uniref:SMODS and SLOG-associating 2TM effector domain-containing protein n=1 Tax=Phytohabitans aurantiacus TaxID=3016789 RepID=A0ABQ5RAD8_9ACTN|nr:S-4TM family putative pore-forming effector [Phytohabitans aurantiacus]GLI03358.1 hypothetical protein Pa4123_86360 [Phytohabitans aurantiacus]